MSIPIRIEKIGDKFAATVVGMPEMRREGSTSAEVIATVRNEIQNRVDDGEIVFVDVNPGGLSALAGKYRDDPTLREICEEAYRLRDAELMTP